MNADRIRGFIQTEILFDDVSVALTNETPLLDGVLDSLGLMQLVAFLEEEFDIEVQDEEVTVEHFRTIADIEGLVNSRVAQR
ncbi:MAG: acyl carrier protein [Actinobacteria bacterium]|nr:acyl carrier protein [Actinomycetota bacterium]